jgi:hypothetical protein
MRATNKASEQPSTDVGTNKPIFIENIPGIGDVPIGKYSFTSILINYYLSL